MVFNYQEPERVACDDGKVYEVLGPTDTRTATHLLFGRRAVPLGRDVYSGCRD